MLRIENPTTDIPPIKVSSPDKNLLTNSGKVIKICKEEYAATGKLSPETESHLKREASTCIEALLAETDREKAIVIARTLATMYALPGGPVDEEIIALHKQMPWEEWGTTEQVSASLSSEESLVKEKANLVSREMLNYYKMDPEKTMQAWRDAVSPMEQKTEKENLFPAEQRRIIFENFSQLRNLELARPDAASFLFKEFGLANFSRYPLKLLIDQYDQRADLKHPYGIIVTARRNYNHAFFKTAGKENLRSLHRQLKGKYRIRAVESGGQFTLARSLVRLNDKYGARQKISFAWIRAHGSKESFSLGDWSEDKPVMTISIEDLIKTKVLKKIRKFFTEHASIILESCETGKKGGIGEKLFEYLGVKVLALQESALVYSITAEDKAGQLDFDLEFLPGGLNSPGPIRAEKMHKYS